MIKIKELQSNFRTNKSSSANVESKVIRNLILVKLYHIRSYTGTFLVAKDTKCESFQTFPDVR